MRLIFLTRDPAVGVIAEQAGIDWIFVDLEYRGKPNRQAGRNTVISAHSVEDVSAMRQALTSAQLLVRINPLGEWSAAEVDGVIAAGADIVMLPYFTTVQEVRDFVALVGRRAKTCLLIETMAAVERTSEMLAVPGINFVHIGLNDIHIERGTDFMFEAFADGTVEGLASQIRPTGIPFGIGGMARIGEKVPPAERVLAEHHRLGSTGVILARAFVDAEDLEDAGRLRSSLESGVCAVRACETDFALQPPSFFSNSRERMIQEICGVAAKIAASRT